MSKLTKITITSENSEFMANTLVGTFPCYRHTANSYIFYPETKWLRLEEILKINNMVWIEQDYEE